MKTKHEILVEKLTERLIRKKYSLNDELKFARKSHEDDEFIVFNEYVEKCIEQAKKDAEKIEETNIKRKEVFGNGEKIKASLTELFKKHQERLRANKTGEKGE